MPPGRAGSHIRVPIPAAFDWADVGRSSRACSSCRRLPINSDRGGRRLPTEYRVRSRDRLVTLRDLGRTLRELHFKYQRLDALLAGVSPGRGGDLGPFFDRLGKSLVALRQWAESVPIEKTARRPLRQVEVQSATIDRVKLERTAYCRVTLQLDLELRVLIPKDAFVAVKFRTSSLISEEQKVHVHPTALTPAAIVDQNRVRSFEVG